MPRHSRQTRRYAQLGIATAFGLALFGCTTDITETSRAKAEGGASAEWGEFSVLIGEDIDLGVAKVSADGKVLGYLDPSCGLIAAAPSGSHEVVVEWETARIS